MQRGALLHARRGSHSASADHPPSALGVETKYPAQALVANACCCWHEKERGQRFVSADLSGVSAHAWPGAAFWKPLVDHARHDQKKDFQTSCCRRSLALVDFSRPSLLRLEIVPVSLCEFAISCCFGGFGVLHAFLRVQTWLLDNFSRRPTLFRLLTMCCKGVFACCLIVTLLVSNRFDFIFYKTCLESIRTCGERSGELLFELFDHLRESGALVVRSLKRSRNLTRSCRTLLWSTSRVPTPMRSRR